MELTKKQSEGLKIAISRFLNKEKYTVIGGYAGTGKSTLVSYIVKELERYGIDSEKDICYASFTGKATQVLVKKGHKNAETLHKLLYKSYMLPDGTYIHKPKKIGEIDYKVLIVDEVSMAPKSMMENLIKHPVYIICLGDPAQLPPINKNEDNHLLDNPHIFLDEVMRQAQESSIIRLSMNIRNGNPIKYQDCEDVKVIPRKDLSLGMLLWADQVLAATNKEKNNLTNIIREHYGYIEKDKGGYVNTNDIPHDGEKIICLKNYWDTFSNQHNPLVNGTIGYVKNPYKNFWKMPPMYGGNILTYLDCDFVSDIGDTYSKLETDLNGYREEKLSIPDNVCMRLYKSKYKQAIPKLFTYGYVITTWKAQGSEWDKVLIIEENFPFNREEHQRFLYTAITRASQKAVLVRT